MTNFEFLRKKNKAKRENAYFDEANVEDIWYQAEHAGMSDLTCGLRLKVQADGELITNGIVDALEEVNVSPALVVNGSADDSADVLLEQLEEGL